MNDWKVTRKLDTKSSKDKNYYTYSVNGFSSPVILPDQFKTARLMASAKDLLEALKLVLDVAALEIPNYEESNSYARAAHVIDLIEYDREQGTQGLYKLMTPEQQDCFDEQCGNVILKDGCISDEQAQNIAEDIVYN